jgi:hypothetical protein
MTYEPIAASDQFSDGFLCMIDYRDLERRLRLSDL